MSVNVLIDNNNHDLMLEAYLLNKNIKNDISYLANQYDYNIMFYDKEFGSEITIKSSWDGTAIPNTGTIQNLYANTNLTEDEVLTELNKLNYVYQQSEMSLDASKRGMYSIVNIPELYLELLIQVMNGDALIATSDFNLILFATK